MLVIVFQIIMLNVFTLKDNYPLSLWKFFCTRSRRLNHSRYTLIFSSSFVDFGQPFLDLSYPFLDFGQLFNVSGWPFLFLVNRLTVWAIRFLTLVNRLTFRAICFYFWSTV